MDSPTLSFTELTVHQYLGDSQTLKVSNQESVSSVTAVTFSSDSQLNLLSISAQNLAIVNETGSVTDYPAVLQMESTTNLFYSEDEQIFGLTTLPKNLKVKYSTEKFV